MSTTQAVCRLKQSLGMLAGLAGIVGISCAIAASNPRWDSAQGFGAGTTGGLGGEAVQVSSLKDLTYQLCRSYSSGICNDDTPRVVQIVGTIDFTGTEGRGKGPGCQYSNICQAPYKGESLLLLDGLDTHCDGKLKLEVSFDKAGKHPLEVGSNKTVIGVGSNAAIRGKGLRLNGVSNVIVRNLTISDINPGIVFAGDAIAISRANRLWIDHNRFHNIGRQMIAGGLGATTNITVSWNDFDGKDNYSSYCNGAHYWNLLFLGSPQSITVANNYFHEVSGRAPHIDGLRSVIHLVNNYFHNTELLQRNGFFHALDAGPSVEGLIEGNYFDNIETPIRAESGHIFGALGGVNGEMQDLCRAMLGRMCVGNIARPAPRINGFRLDESVIRSFGALPKAAIRRPFQADDVPALITANTGPGHL